MPRASDPANQTEFYRHLRGAGGSIALTVERDGEELTREVGLIPVEPASAGEELRVVHRRLVSNGGTWWTYSERLLPARPYDRIARAGARTSQGTSSR